MNELSSWEMIDKNTHLLTVKTVCGVFIKKVIGHVLIIVTKINSLKTKKLSKATRISIGKIDVLFTLPCKLTESVSL